MKRSKIKIHKSLSPTHEEQPGRAVLYVLTGERQYRLQITVAFLLGKLSEKDACAKVKDAQIKVLSAQLTAANKAVTTKMQAAKQALADKIKQARILK